MQRQRPVADEQPQALHELRHRLRAKVLSRPQPDGDVLRGSRAVPYHHHEGYFFELRPSDLALHALVGVVDVNPEVEVVQPLRDFPRVLHVPVSDWDDTRLDGREPNQKRAGGGSMLLPLALCAADTSSCITSQCSAILPLATRKIVHHRSRSPSEIAAVNGYIVALRHHETWPIPEFSRKVSQERLDRSGAVR